MLNKKYIQCDVCVVGGGMAGVATAISAAREGVHVCLRRKRIVGNSNVGLRHTR